MEGRVLLLPLFKQATGCNHNPDNNGFTVEDRKNEDNLYGNKRRQKLELEIT